MVGEFAHCSSSLYIYIYVPVHGTFINEWFFIISLDPWIIAMLIVASMLTFSAEQRSSLVWAFVHIPNQINFISLVLNVTKTNHYVYRTNFKVIGSDWFGLYFEPRSKCNIDGTI